MTLPTIDWIRKQYPEGHLVRELGERIYELERDQMEADAALNEIENACGKLINRNQILERAIHEASYLLHPNQGEPPDPSLAAMWLRTAYPLDHPNYLSPDALKHYIGQDLSKTTDCKHEWIDIRNEVIQSGQMCFKCRLIRPGNVEE